jgi:hypothetical protein
MEQLRPSEEGIENTDVQELIAKVQMEEERSSLLRAFAALRSNDPNDINAGLTWINEQMHENGLFAGLLLSFAEEFPAYVTHCLTFYGHWIDCHQDVFSLPPDLEDRPFLDVADLILLANPTANALLAKPIITIWLRTQKAEPSLGDILVHYRTSAHWLPLTVSLLSECAFFDAIGPFISLIPSVIVDAFTNGFQTLHMDILHLFSTAVKLISNDEHCEFDLSIWETPIQYIFRLAEESPSLPVGEFTEIWTNLAHISCPFTP